MEVIKEDGNLSLKPALILLICTLDFKTAFNVYSFTELPPLDCVKCM